MGWSCAQQLQDSVFAVNLTLRGLEPAILARSVRRARAYLLTDASYVGFDFAEGWGSAQTGGVGESTGEAREPERSVTVG